MWAWGWRRFELPGVPLRIGSALLLATTLLLPLVPGHGWVICPLRATTGIPCPLCGMTTSVTATGRGRLGDAVAANPAGVLAVALAIAILVLRPDRLRVPVGVGLAAVGAMWLFQLFRFSVL